MLIAVSAILLVLGILAYRRSFSGRRPGSKSEPRGQSAEGAWLLVLRLLMLLVFAAIFVGATIERVWTVRPRRVVVLLDVSESMSAVRAESAAAAVAAGFLLPSGTAREVWLFADTAVKRGDQPQAPSSSAPPLAPLPSPLASHRNVSSRTRIGAALERAARTRPAAVVLLSDGQDNGETDAMGAARRLGIPVHTVGFGGTAQRNLSITQVVLPAAVYSGDTVDVRVRVAATGLAGEKAGVRLRGEAKEIVLGQAMAEQDVQFRLVFDRPGSQSLEVRADSLADEANYADNVRTAMAEVKPRRIRVRYVTNRPGPGTRLVLRALAGDERIELLPAVAVRGEVELTGSVEQAAPADVYLLDNVVETGSVDVWQKLAASVEGGTGLLILAGPEFRPGQHLGRMVSGAAGSVQAGSFTPELTAEGRLLPWWRMGPAQESDGREVADLSRVPPFTGCGSGFPSGTSRTGVLSHEGVWLVAEESNTPLVMAGKAKKGRVVYVAGYPLWRWGFGPGVRPDQATSLSCFLTGVVRYLAEREATPFRLQPERSEVYHGETVRLLLRALAPDGGPWARLSVTLAASSLQQPATDNMPMTETSDGIYQATLEALGPGDYRATATVSLDDTVLGRASATFAVAEQPIELARTGLNEGLLRAIAAASGGRYFPQDSLPGDGSEVALGSYQRRLVLDPRRAIWAYVLVPLLAGAEWVLRRRKGLL